MPPSGGRPELKHLLIRTSNLLLNHFIRLSKPISKQLTALLPTIHFPLLRYPHLLKYALCELRFWWASPSPCPFQMTVQTWRTYRLGFEASCAQEDSLSLGLKSSHSSSLWLSVWDFDYVRVSTKKNHHKIRVIADTCSEGVVQVVLRIRVTQHVCIRYGGVESHPTPKTPLAAVRVR